MPARGATSAHTSRLRRARRQVSPARWPVTVTKPKLRTDAPLAWASRSSTRTVQPRCTAANACASPTMPAPTTSTSLRRFMSSRSSEAAFHAGCDDGTMTCCTGVTNGKRHAIRARLERTAQQAPARHEAPSVAIVLPARATKECAPCQGAVTAVLEVGTVNGGLGARGIAELLASRGHLACEGDGIAQWQHAWQCGQLAGRAGAAGWCDERHRTQQAHPPDQRHHGSVKWSSGLASRAGRG